jgi:hypothetical protein
MQELRLAPYGWSCTVRQAVAGALREGALSHCDVCITASVGHVVRWREGLVEVHVVRGCTGAAAQASQQQGRGGLLLAEQGVAGSTCSAVHACVLLWGAAVEELLCSCQSRSVGQAQWALQRV